MPPLSPEERLQLLEAWQQVLDSEISGSLALIFSRMRINRAEDGAAVRSQLQIELILRSLNRSSERLLANHLR